MWEQYMPQWPAGAKSYPTQILGDMTSAVVLVTDTPELFGGEIRTISIADLEDGKIVRLVDYWDGRGFGAELAGSLRVPADSYPHDLGVSTVASRPGPIATAARELTAAFAAGDADRAGELFSYDAVFEDMALRTQLRGQAAIVRYLRRALPGLPYARASVRHVAGAGQGGGYEWLTASRLPPGRPRSSSARTTRSPSSPSYRTAHCSTTGPSHSWPPTRSTGDPSAL
jgi:ketosteroid isomerase-like protein